MSSDLSASRFGPFADVLMLRLDIAAVAAAAIATSNAADPSNDKPARVHYITPFVTDGTKLYIFEEPGERSDELDELLLNRTAEISSTATGDLTVTGTGQRPTADEEAWARDACSARFHYDQALQDIAQLGSVIAIA